MKSLPKKYYKNVLSVDYDKLKKDGIKCLIFDLDNTLAPANSNEVSKEIINKIKSLKKSFTVYILSNNSHRERLDTVSNALNITPIKLYTLLFPSEVTIFPILIFSIIMHF